MRKATAKKQLTYSLLILIPLSIISSFFIYYLLSRPKEPDKAGIELYFRASEAYEEGNLALCVSLTEALMKGNSSFFQARLLNGKALFFSDRFKEAAQIFGALLKDYSRYTEAEIWMIRSLIQLEDLSGAEKMAEEVLSRSPDDPRILGLLARTAAIKGDYQKALEYYNRAILFEEELAINRIELAGIYGSLMNPEMATEHLEHSLRLLSADSPLRYGIQRILEQGEPR